MAFLRERFNWHLAIRRLLALVLLVGLILYALWPWLPGKQGPSRTLVLYGFSILSEVIDEGIFPAFQAEWESRTGEKVELVSSYAGSGTITNQIILGVPAEIAIFSLEPDAFRLVENNILPAFTWRELPYNGIINLTPLIIMVRPGNPYDIRDFADLARPGIGVVHPDPLTSGGAQWALLAEYGSALRLSGNDSIAYKQLLGIWDNVVAQSSSARGARTQFENGFGHALITYEQEALFDRSRNRLNAEIVYPKSTILSEHTVVKVQKNIDPDQRRFIDAFVAFLWTRKAQEIFVGYGFRSVDESLNQHDTFGTINDPFTVTELGGWENAKPDIIDKIWKNRVLSEIKQ